MKKILVIVCMMLITASVFVSCKKYPDGPGISLRSKKSRLENSWKIVKFTLNGEDKTADAQNTYYKDYVLAISKSGTYTLNYSFFTLPVNETGKWEFADDKRQVAFTKETGNTGASIGDKTNWTILKLKANEMWAQQIQSNGDLYVIHLETK